MKRVEAKWLLPCAVALVWLPAMAVASAGAGPARGSFGVCFDVVEDRALPAELQSATDVRGAGPQEALVAAYDAGLFRLALMDKTVPPALEMPAGSRREALWLPVHLGLSRRHLAVSGPGFWAGWAVRGEATLSAQTAFEHVFDLDLNGERLLLLGTRRDDAGALSPKGAVAWTGSVSRDLEDLKPVFFSKDGPGAKSMDACGMMEIGAARWLRDGSFVLVPGVEPDVYLYDSAWRLLRTWQHEAVGFDAGCGLSWAEMHRYSADEAARHRWVAERRIVDDVLPLPEGPGLILRSVRDGAARWQLAVLERDAGITRCPIPIENTSELSYLHADMWGDRVVFLVIEKGPLEERRAAGFVPRLVTATWLR